MAMVSAKGKAHNKDGPWLTLLCLLTVIGLGACGPAEMEPLFGGPLPVTREAGATETLPVLQPAPSATPSRLQNVSATESATPGPPPPVLQPTSEPFAFETENVEETPFPLSPDGPTPTAWDVPSRWPTPTPVPPPAGLLYENQTGVWLVADDWQPEQLPYIERGAFLSPDLRKAFVSEDSDLWLIDLTSGERLNLTEGTERLHCCAQWWAARPGLIIFVSWPASVDPDLSARYLSVYDLDNGAYLVLDEETPSIGWPAPGPDGQRIAYDRGGTSWIYHWDRGPEALDPLDFGLDNIFRIGGPAWSPDGRQIAWTVAVADPASDPWRIALAIFDLDTGRGLLLHSYDNLGRGGWFDPPAWSPDGQWLAFVAEDIDPEKYGLWVVASDGSGEHFLGPGANPIWSPDNHWLSYTAYSPELDPAEEIRLAEVGSWYSIRMNLPPGSTIRAWYE